MNKNIKRWKHFWTSGTDIIFESNYYWGITGRDIDWRLSWHDGEPNGGTRENCLALMTHTKRDEFLFNDVLCSDSLFMICQKIEDGNC
jgi:hypothetical protein